MTGYVILRAFPIFFITMAATSCSWTGKDGTRRSLVLGIAVISTAEKKIGDARVTKTSVYGVALQRTPAMSGLIFGYSDSLLTEIPPRWEGQFTVSTPARKAPTVAIAAQNSKQHSATAKPSR